MAIYGAKYLQWAPFAQTDADVSEAAPPKYDTPMNLGALQQVSDSPTLNEAKAYGDNVLKNYVNEFKECPVTVGITELSNDVASAVLGATIAETSQDLEFGAEDDPPYGGLGFYVTKQLDDGSKKWQGIAYPKVKASMQGTEYNTKGDSITFAGGRLQFMASVPANGKWKIQSKDFDTEAEAKTWVDGIIKKASA